MNFEIYNLYHTVQAIKIHFWQWSLATLKSYPLPIILPKDKLQP